MERAELKTRLRETGCVCEAGEFVFLCDPQATSMERSAIDAALAQAAAMPASSAERGWLCIRTGGSSGGVKFARHDEHTLGAAVRGYCAHFKTDRVNAIGVLPLHHVSGLMAWLRCAMTGGEYRAWDWKRLEAGQLPLPAAGNWVISLVPTQLHRLLADARTTGWLGEFRAVFLGGGHVWPELADAAARARLPISLTYGMTETAAMVTALLPEEFRAGHRSSGRPLPHAGVGITQDEVISVWGDSLFRGYFPNEREGDELITEDIGEWNQHGELVVFGRRDAMIITGGKKVSPTDVEAALRASGEFADVAVIGLPNHEWGEAVVACYPVGRDPDLARATRDLAGYQRPKRFVAIPAAEWPRNAQGKLNRATLQRLASRGNAL